MKWATTWGSSTPGGPLLFGPNSTTNPTLSWKTRAPSDPWNVGREGATAEGDGGGTGLLFDEHGPGEQSEKGGRTSPNPHREDTVDLWPTRHQHPSSGTVWWGGVGWDREGEDSENLVWPAAHVLSADVLCSITIFCLFGVFFYQKKRKDIKKKHSYCYSEQAFEMYIYLYLWLLQ